MPKSKAAPAASQWRSRIVDHGSEAPDQLLANPLNWRIHPKAQQDALGAVLDEIGWVQDVIVNRRTGHVVDGHLRVSLAISRGEPTIPVVYVDLDENEERIVLATIDPLSAMAVRDDDLLAQLLGDTHTDSDDLAALLAEVGGNAGAKAGLTDPDEVPEPPAEPVSKRGDLWLLGEHRVLCGDSTSADDVARVLSGAVPNLMVTDPPYGVEYEPEWREAYDQFERHSTGHVANDDRVDWSEAIALFPGSVAYVWHASYFTAEVGAHLKACGYEIRSSIIWAKQHFTFGRGHYHWQHEPCWYAVKKGGTAKWAGDRTQTTIWDIANKNPMGGQQDDVNSSHGTQKPVECMARPIRNHEGDVYDPFLGSGTTLIAAEQLGRRCYGMEIEPRYVDVIVARWEAFTGKKAVLAE